MREGILKDRVTGRWLPDKIVMLVGILVMCAGVLIFDVLARGARTSDHATGVDAFGVGLAICAVGVVAMTVRHLRQRSRGGQRRDRD
jgi:hypothetical protein